MALINFYDLMTSLSWWHEIIKYNKSTTRNNKIFQDVPVSVSFFMRKNFKDSKVWQKKVFVDLHTLKCVGHSSFDKSILIA